MKYEVQQILNQGSGVIVNNSSMGGLIAFAGINPYNASKHTVMGLTRSAALDCAKQDIRINAINPGLIATEMMDRLSTGSTPEQLASSIVPMGRLGQSEEIAAAVVFLCSDAASYMTGQSLVLDGGYTAA
jgi:NAD(P)-dependent dehydrogenase (short-subunit alcohol dehydrogenase family)